MSLNKGILLGRLTADPELRQAGNSSACSFCVAVDRDFKNKDGERETDFIDCVAWSKTGEFVSKWFKKGSMIAVAGRIQTRMWEDKQGNKRKSTELVVEEASFAGSKADSQPAQPTGNEYVGDPMAAIPGGFAPAPGDESDVPF